MNRVPSNKHGGFTLIEIIIAVTILGLALVAVLQVFSLGMTSARRSQKTTMAVSVAQNIMEEVLSRDVLEEGVEQGSIEDLGMDYSIDIQPSSLEGLHQVQVDVSWIGGGKAFELFCLIPDEGGSFSLFPR